MKFLRKVQKIKDEIFPPKKKLSNFGEKCTKWEIYFFEKSNWHCPNCEIGQLYEGPGGGMSQNIRCHTCGQGYNIVPMFGNENIGIDESYINKVKLRKVKLNKIKNN
ncbi:MAG: hypothetical protein ACOCVF_03335 [bacterium]